MTTKELIAALSLMPQDLQVIIYHNQAEDSGAVIGVEHQTKADNDLYSKASMYPKALEFVVIKGEIDETFDYDQ